MRVRLIQNSVNMLEFAFSLFSSVDCQVFLVQLNVTQIIETSTRVFTHPLHTGLPRVFLNVKMLHFRNIVSDADIIEYIGDIRRLNNMLQKSYFN